MRPFASLSVAVVGSVNLDLVASVDRLPLPGETVLGVTLARHPGGKGANQALAARRLGATVELIARVGDDAEAALALALLREAGVGLSGCRTDPAAPTGIAMIAVAADGENHIVVIPGANAVFDAAALVVPGADVLICQLEIPVATVARAAALAGGFVCLNLAPAIDPAATALAAALARADLIVVNEAEAAALRHALETCAGLVATTLGGAGAVLTRGGIELARRLPPRVMPVDTTGAGDAFTAALALALAAGRDPDVALDIACATGALATTLPGAQPSLPSAAAVAALLGRVAL